MEEARKEDKAVEHSGLLFYSRAIANPERLPVQDRDKKYEYFLLTRDAERDEAGGVPKALTGEYLIKVAAEKDDKRGVVVSFVFGHDGTQLLADLTTKNKGRQMAIVLDDQIQSAPTIQQPLPNGRGIIYGNYSSEEAERIVEILRSGALPATLRPVPVSETTVEPAK